MLGIYNRILKVDLTNKAFKIEDNGIPLSIYETFLGGKGLGTYLLYKYNPPGVDPLSPDNHIVFATGPVAGSRIWGSCRYGVFTKSPQTMLYSESYSGGKAPEALDSAGYGAITSEIVPVGDFYYAEDYHQQYLSEAKHPNGYCSIGPNGLSCPIGVATIGDADPR